MKVAALYVQTDGPYYGLEDVDPWDERRDARLYAGPHPVVAHPPCAAWCRWSWLRERDGYGRQGEDGGCFAAALHAVRAFGGVLEHPANTKAWAAFGLPAPTGPEWTNTLLDDGWVVAVDQASYGHRANKPTWLYYFGGAAPCALDTSPPPTKGIGAKGLHSGHRHLTPAPFREILLELARSAAMVPA